MITKIVSAKYPSRLAKIISKVCSLFLPIHLIQNLKLPYYKKLELEPDELDSIMGDLVAMPWRNKE